MTRKIRQSGQTEGRQSLTYAALDPRNLLTSVVGERTFFTEVPSSTQPHEIVANYRDDFGLEGTRWEYLWNGSGVDEQGSFITGALDQPENFRSLQRDGSVYRVGNESGISQAGSDSLFLSSEAGHPGLQVTRTNGQDRYAIAAFRVAETGFYSIVDSVINRFRDFGDGIEIVVWVADEFENRRTFTAEPGAEFTSDFDTNVGFVRRGESIYVAVGQGGNYVGDSFRWDFSIAQFYGQEVGNFHDDFRTGNPSWRYLWNAPVGQGGQLLDTSTYRPLQFAGDRLTPDGDLNFEDPSSGFLRLDQNGGATGRIADSNNEHTRYAITSFRVSDSGYYAITDSFFAKSRSQGEALRLVVHNEDGEIFASRQVDPLQTQSFDTYLGFLNANERIYVAVGGTGSNLQNAFEHDFTIVAEPFLRPDPVIDLQATTEVHVSDFGALPDDGISDQDGIQQAINAAIALQTSTDAAVRVVLDAGTYRLDQEAQTQLRFTRANDIVFQGAGADSTELLIVHANSAGIRIDNSEDVILRDFSIDYEELPFTQGSIEGIINDTTLLISVDEGYAAPNDRSLFTDSLTSHRTQFLTADRTGRLVNNETYRVADLDSIRQIDSNTFVVSYDGALPEGLSVGDAWYQIARDNLLGNIRVLRNSGAITAYNVVSYASPSGFIQGQANNIVDAISVRIDLKDDRLVSVLGDAVHSQRNQLGSWIEDSTFVGLSDDVFTLYRLELDYISAQTAANRFELKTDVDLFAGERVLFYRPDGYREEAKIVSVEDGVLVTDRAISGYDSQTSLAPLNRATNGSVIRDNVFGQHRAGQGTIVALSPNTTIVGNSFSAINARAISTNAYEPTLSDGLLVQGNQFHDVGFSAWLDVTEWPAIETGEGTHNNVVQDNVFSSLFGAAVRDLGVESYLADNFFANGDLADVELEISSSDRRALFPN